MRPRRVLPAALAALGVALLAACSSTGPRSAAALGAAGEAAAPGRGAGGVAIHCAKILTMDDEDRIYSPGTLLVRGSRIEYVGERVETPAGYAAVEMPATWAYPGLVDLHTHIHTGLWGRQPNGYADDVNDMLQAVNPELSAAPTFLPSNPEIELAGAGGVTTLFGIPGSGTSLSGFGVLYKPKNDSTFEESVFADPGGMKVAQTNNPERWSDFGATRAGLAWVLEDVNDRALAALRQERFDPALENLAHVHAKELPVLIHCAGEGVTGTARMWRGTYDTLSTLSHGSFDGWKMAPYVAAMGMPVNHGPRTTDFFSTRDGRIVGTSAEFVDAGVPNFSLNTDSKVIPEHEFWVQGAVSARMGMDAYQALRALTIHPAKSFGIADRVGSLEVGKHADIVLHSGDLLDPRERVEMVWIDGRVEYARERDGQRF